MNCGASSRGGRKRLRPREGLDAVRSDWRTRYDAAITATHEASCIALRYFTGDFQVEWKHDETPVTIADRETEAFLRTSLLRAFPEDGFLGEESGDRVG